jgi:hypothetical protein
MSAIIPLDEGTYVFKIEHTGEKGFTSIVTEVSGRVYGANYISTLDARGIDAVTVYKDSVIINWAIADANVSKVLLTYETTSGTEKTVEVAPNVVKTKLTDSKLQGKYSYVTCILEEGAFEELSVPSDNSVFPFPNYPLNKTGWIPSSPYNNPSVGGGLGALIDDNYDTFWCSLLPGTAHPDPYWIQVDMLNTKHVTNIRVDERLNVLQMKVESSLDGSIWNELGILEWGPNIQHGIGNLSFDDAIPMQYIRFTSMRSTDPDGRNVIWEIDVTGYED